MSDRSGFIEMVRSSLGRNLASTPASAPETGLSQSYDELKAAAGRIRADMSRRADSLLSSFATAAVKNSWKVTRAENYEHAAEVVASICRAEGIKSALRSDEEIFSRVPVDSALKSLSIEIGLAVSSHSADLFRDAESRARLKRLAFSVGCGITGSDFAIAETGTVVLHPRAGLSRLVSLAPPVHIAIIERGSVLPSLDELFLLEREALIMGRLSGSMNLISGPSRTGDIEATVVRGIHGPLETHAVLIG